MKQILLSFALLACVLSFPSCDNTKTYAEKLADEKSAIDKFIRDSSIVVLSNFKADSTFGAKEYVKLTNGVYLNIVKRGDLTDRFKTRDVILTRSMEFSIFAGAETWANSFMGGYPDQFTYSISNTIVKGNFTDPAGIMYIFYAESYGTAVSEGWLVPLQFLGDYSEIKIIVPSKTGHLEAQGAVSPYFYNISYQKF